jgi:beta-glucuronidase
VYFESVQQSAKGTEADIVIYVKNSLPCYILRNYKLVWKTASGKMKEIVMPELKPGEKYKTTIDELNPQEKPLVQVVRPTGYLVSEF